MTLRLLLSVLVLTACGGSTKPPAQPDPVAAVPETQEAAAIAPPARGKLALGEVTIAMHADTGKEIVDGEIVLTADGAIRSSMTSSDKQRPNKTMTGRLTPDGELFDNKNEVIAKLGDDGTITARQVTEESMNGKVVKTETKMKAVGKLDDDGVFTRANDGQTLRIDDQGNLGGLPAEFTVTAKPAQKRAAMFVVIAMFAASKVVVSLTSSAPPAALKK